MPFDESIQDSTVSSSNVNSLEKYKFFIDDNGKVRSRVQGLPSGNILEGISFDYVSASYPNDVTEVYNYYLGGIAGTLMTTITVVYTDSTKEQITTLEKS